jgi:hypothetical protein
VRRCSDVLFTRPRLSLSRPTDLYDSMFQLVDSFTFKLRQIAPNMWPIFELTYKLFKGNAIDFLDGKPILLARRFGCLIAYDVA